MWGFHFTLAIHSHLCTLKVEKYFCDLFAVHWGIVCRGLTVLSTGLTQSCYSQEKQLSCKVMGSNWKDHTTKYPKRQSNLLLKIAITTNTFGYLYFNSPSNINLTWNIWSHDFKFKYFWGAKRKKKISTTKIWISAI